MDIMDAIHTPKRRQIMLHMLYAYEEDRTSVLPPDLCGWRSVEWISPRFDDTYYIFSSRDGKKIRKKVMEFLRVLKKEKLVLSKDRLTFENELSKYFEKPKVHNFKREIGIIRNISTLWRINPALVRELKQYFDNMELVRTAIDLREVNALINRLHEHLETLEDIKSVLSSSLSEKTRVGTRGDILDVHKELELCEAKITWVKADLELFKQIIG